jgi:adenine-specific DNA-methyltransferase
MLFDFGYMGTKRALAASVAEIVSQAKNGPILDAFSGMCAVGQTIGTDRQIWSNDIQVFASKVSHALFVSLDMPPTMAQVAIDFYPDFSRNVEALTIRFRKRLAEETASLSSGGFSEVEAHAAKYELAHASRNTIAEAAKCALEPRAFPYRLFSLLYANSYLGLRQCILIDSIVFAIRKALDQRTITPDQRDWLMLALGQAMLRCSSTTGHFAQYLTPKTETLTRYIRQRTRDLWSEWLQTVSTLCPVGSKSWRRKNRTYNTETVSLLRTLSKRKMRPGVIYADPPYTDDQYSRYYHLLETLFAYDYPIVASKGRYRPNRFQAAFSQKAKTVTAFRQLVTAASAIGADLIVSYPANGLIQAAGSNPSAIMRERFKQVSEVYRSGHSHSSFGASKGAATKDVIEVIYFAQ